MKNKPIDYILAKARSLGVILTKAQAAAIRAGSCSFEEIVGWVTI